MPLIRIDCSFGCVLLAIISDVVDILDAGWLLLLFLSEK